MPSSGNTVTVVVSEIFVVVVQVLSPSTHTQEVLLYLTR